jgi:ribosomal protein L13
MKARLVKFGEIEVEGKRYTHDVVIEGGKVRKRKKGPSKHRRAVKGMLPHNRLGTQQLRKLKVYPGSDHPHQAQQPEPLA